MKQKFHFCALFFFIVFLLASEQLAARALSVKHGGGEVEKLDVQGDEDSLPKTENTDSANELMGLEGCENGDKECFGRRDLAEAHLDYIYTQHHKP